MKMTSWLTIFGGAMVIAGLLIAVYPTGAFMPTEAGGRSAIRFAVLPDQDETTLRAHYEPLIQFVSRNIGRDAELVIPENYEDLLELFGQGQVDVALFGGVTFVKARRDHGALPLVMRDTDLLFRSYFLTQADNPLQSIDDFKGKYLSFGSHLSTSGHLMPRYFLERRDIHAETFFGKVTYSGAHDKTAILVQDGQVDLGAVNAPIVHTMYRNGRLDPNKVKVIFQTPTYTDYVWAVQPKISVTIREQLIQAFTLLDPSIKAQADILKGVDAGGYLPARFMDFQNLDQIAEKQGLL